MKKLYILFALIILCSCMSSSSKKEFSKEALSETLLSYNGQQITFKDILEKHKGQNVVIEVWASWCSDCVKAMPKLKELQSNNPKVSFVFISMDKTVEKWKEGIAKHELTGDQYMANDQMKGKFGTAIDLDWIPRYIIIDKNGEIVTYRAIETDFDKMNTTLKTLE